MTNARQDSGTGAVYMAMEVGEKEWRLAFTDLRENRYVTVPSWDQGKLVEEVKKAKKHFGLPAASAVYSCYEAGRCGFSIHRFLESKGMKNKEERTTISHCTGVCWGAVAALGHPGKAGTRFGVGNPSPHSAGLSLRAHAEFGSPRQRDG